MLNVYRASAGSGKTHRLTGDYIELLFSEKNNNRMYRRVLAVTFTNKATGEMKNRILSQLFNLAEGKKSDYRQNLITKYRLSEATVNERARKILVSLLHDYTSFSVSTIDSFFQQLIRSFARENGINGAYNLELDNEIILQQATDNLFIELAGGKDNNLLQWLTQFASDLISDNKSWNPRENILKLGRELFKENFQSKSTEIAKQIQNHEFLRTYQRQLKSIIENYEQTIASTGKRAMDIMAQFGLDHTHFSRTSTIKFEQVQNKIYKEAGVTFQAMAEDVTKCYVKKQTKDIVEKITNAYIQGLGQCFKDVVYLLSDGQYAYNSAKIILKNLNTLGVLSYLDSKIKALTHDQNTMLISDANMLVNKIIDGSDTPFIFEKTGVYKDNFMIDEFQDTSALQWKNFKPLIENSLATDGFNLVVGDVKQSIYRWRNSEWKLLDRAIFDDFRNEQLQETTLDTNWRSDRNIVQFNNAFFSYAPQILQANLNLQIPEEKKNSEAFSNLTDAIVHAYKKSEQKPRSDAGTGFVQFTFIEKGEDDEKWKTMSLERLPALLEELQDDGFAPKDVAILVREKKDIKDITQKLLEYKNSSSADNQKYCYDVLGNEGLLISKSGGVNFIISLLKLFMQPDDVISKLNVSFEYLKGKNRLSEQQALHMYFDTEIEKTPFSPFFNTDENVALKNVANFSLYELTEEIIRIFGINTWSNAAVYLQAFRDEVYNFSNGRKSDLSSFMKWWDETGCKKFIPIPENQNAFQIMTIHKSKGLDFKVVIMPFCNWELDMKKGNLTNYLWCSPTTEPFNQLSILPVEYSKRLENSIFEREYFDEKMHRYIDNLNLAYVAFTRAKHRLICFSEKVKFPENISKINTLAQLLMWSFTNENIPEIEKPEILTKHFDAEQYIFEFGEKTQITSGEQPNTTNELTNLQAEPDKIYRNKPELKFRKTKIISGAQSDFNQPRKLGIVMHAVLGKIQKKSEQENALRKCINEGIFSIAQKKEVLNELEKFWSMPETAEWFANDAKVLNETTILTPTGEMYRPDRVVIKANNVIVVDYKFGEYEKNSYERQVKEYMKLLQEMKYNTKGYIYYVNLGKVEEVI